MFGFFQAFRNRPFRKSLKIKNAGISPPFSLLLLDVEQHLNAPALAPGIWTHVAVTLSGSTATLYLDGTEIGINRSMSLTPASLGSTTQNYIGKSQWNDPLLDGAWVLRGEHPCAGPEVLGDAQHVAGEVVEVQRPLVVVGFPVAARVPRRRLVALRRKERHLGVPVLPVPADAVQEQDQRAASGDRDREPRRRPDEDRLQGYSALAPEIFTALLLLSESLLM